MSVGIVFAQRRLRNHGIYCINPNVINVCGVINLTCFDKTGTLTEDGLDLWGVVPNRDGVLEKPEFEPSKLGYGPLIECMATCHSLTRIDGVLSGDPLDVKMFQSTKWQVELTVRCCTVNTDSVTVSLSIDRWDQLSVLQVGLLRIYVLT
ncbi:unnamed protein product [Schistosoma margrebowiei]|uniref:Uncharacterized protein n=1 Tax=Schistosoma margrebowiei TaxID=48269 RepID=A0A183M7H2_9TREM|nr:unnamed protein product [Schistosoma margrebowiei]